MTTSVERATPAAWAMSPNPLARGPIMRGFGRATDTGVIGSIGVSNHNLTQWQKAEAAAGQPNTTDS